MVKLEKPAVPDVLTIPDETWDRAVLEVGLRKRKIRALDVVRAAMCLQRTGEYQKNHRMKLPHFVVWSIAGGAVAALNRSRLKKTGVDYWVSPGAVALTLRMVTAGLEKEGFFAPYGTGNDFAYLSPTRRSGTLNLHDRGGERYRFVIDSALLDPEGTLNIYPTRPKSYKGPAAGHEFTCMIGEFSQVIPWLVRWIVAYDCGAELPLMPDGQAYPGGYQCTQAVRAHLGLDHG
jgi:hypothetical protein